jgi:hypothetical protein
MNFVLFLANYFVVANVEIDETNEDYEEIQSNDDCTVWPCSLGCRMR